MAVAVMGRIVSTAAKIGIARVAGNRIDLMQEDMD